MLHHDSNSEGSLDSGADSPQFPQGPLSESSGLDPDRVVAYLRSVIRTPEPPPKPEPRLLGFLWRRRPAEAGIGIHIEPAPETRAHPAAPPAETVPAPPAFVPVVVEAVATEPEPVAPVVIEAAAPEPIIEQSQPEPLPSVSPEPSVAESLELESAPAVSVEAEEPIPAAQAAATEPYEILAAEAAAAQPAEEPATSEFAEEPAALAESFAAAAAPESFPAEAAPKPILESAPEPVAATAAEPIPEPIPEPIFEPIFEPPVAASVEPAPDAPPRPTLLRGEVLPPEAFRSGSPERRRPAEPARVITMQPGARGTRDEPPRRA